MTGLSPIISMEAVSLILESTQVAIDLEWEEVCEEGNLGKRECCALAARK